jgi:hypothetical protein
VCEKGCSDNLCLLKGKHRALKCFTELLNDRSKGFARPSKALTESSKALNDSSKALNSNSKALNGQSKALKQPSKGLKGCSKEVFRLMSDLADVKLIEGAKKVAIDKKRINNRAEQIDDAWEQGAPTAKFKGHTHASLVEDRASIRTEEQEIEDLYALIALKQKSVDDKYIRLDDKLVDIRKGVEGHEDFGDDHPILSAMGFVRASERKSGKTNKTKNSGGSGENQ